MSFILETPRRLFRPRQTLIQGTNANFLDWPRFYTIESIELNDRHVRVYVLSHPILFPDLLCSDAFMVPSRDCGSISSTFAAKAAVTPVKLLKCHSFINYHIIESVSPLSFALSFL